MIIFILFFISILFYQFTTTAKQKGLFIIFSISLLLKLILLFLSENNIFIPTDGGSDAVGFIKESYKIYNSKDFLGYFDTSRLHGFGSYPYFLSILYKIFYPCHLIILFINILFHNSILIIMKRSLDLLKITNQNKYFLLSITAFFPLILFYSVISIREIIYIWYITFMCYNILYLKRKNKLFSSPIIIIFISIIVSILHIANIVILPVSFFLFYKSGKFIKVSIVFLLLIGFLKLLTDANINLSYISFLNSNDDSLVLNKINESRVSSSAFYPKYYSNSLVNNIMYALPVDYLNFTFRPFIYPFSNIYKNLFRYPSGLISLMLFFIVIKNYRKSGKFEKKMFFFFLIIIIPFVIGSGDMFQAVRHRMNYFTLIILLLGLFLQYKKYNKYG